MRRALCVTGCTGIGKSTAASMMRSRLDGELISADSVKVVRGLRIGAHKVYDEQHPIHMYDVVDLQDHYTVQDFAVMANERAQSLLDRGKLPIFFGGASMYLEWLLFGTGSAPPTTRADKDAAEAELRSLPSWQEAVRYASSLDAAGAANVLENDYYRLARVVAVARSGSGTTYSSVTGFEEPQLQLDLRGAFIYPADREQLYRSLDRRCEKMLADGLLEEVAQLLHEHGGSFPRKISTIVGYRQTIEFLTTTRRRPTDFREYLKRFQNATRAYARRQMMYFRKSTKLHSALRAIPASPTRESMERVCDILDELVTMTPEQYAADPRWREAIPQGDPGTLRNYVGRAEVFNDPANVELLLDRLRNHLLSLKD